jgi:hypothetical protein
MPRPAGWLSLCCGAGGGSPFVAFQPPVVGSSARGCKKQSTCSVVPLRRRSLRLARSRKQGTGIFPSGERRTRPPQSHDDMKGFAIPGPSARRDRKGCQPGKADRLAALSH